MRLPTDIILCNYLKAYMEQYLMTNKPRSKYDAKLCLYPTCGKHHRNSLYNLCSKHYTIVKNEEAKKPKKPEEGRRNSLPAKNTVPSVEVARMSHSDGELAGKKIVITIDYV